MIEQSIVQLDLEEEVLGIIRGSIIVDFFAIFFSVVWLLLPFFFFFPLVRLGGFGLVIFLALLLGAIWNAVKRRIQWKYTMFIVTDRRIIDVDQIGVFERNVSELAFKDVGDVIIKQSGVINKLFDIGTIRVETTKANHFDLELNGVKNPEHVRNLLVDVQCLKEEYVQKAKSKKEIE